MTRRKRLPLRMTSPRPVRRSKRFGTSSMTTRPSGSANPPLLLLRSTTPSTRLSPRLVGWLVDCLTGLIDRFSYHLKWRTSIIIDVKSTFEVTVASSLLEDLPRPHLPSALHRTSTHPWPTATSRPRVTLSSRPCCSSPPPPPMTSMTSTTRRPPSPASSCTSAASSSAMIFLTSFPSTWDSSAELWIATHCPYRFVFVFICCSDMSSVACFCHCEHI